MSTRDKLIPLAVAVGGIGFIMWRNYQNRKAKPPNGSWNDGLEYHGTPPTKAFKSVAMVNVSEASYSQFKFLAGTWTKTLTLSPSSISVFPPESKDVRECAHLTAIDAFACVGGTTPAIVEMVHFVIGDNVIVGGMMTPQELSRKFGGKKIIVRYALSCCYGSSDKDVVTISNEFKGYVLPSPAGSIPTSWNAVLSKQIDGTPLNAFNTFSALPIVSLMCYLVYGVSFSTLNDPLYEVHITVSAKDDADEERFRDLCHNVLEGKCVAIQLPAIADHARQPMLSYYHRGNLHSCLLKMYGHYGATIAQNGFQVTRLKIEFQLSSDDSSSPIAAVPATTTNNITFVLPPLTESVAQEFPSNYFEFHIKLKLPFDKVKEQQEIMREIGKRHHAHVSRNAFKKDPVGNVIWFMTLRMYNISKTGALQLFEACVGDVRKSGLDIVSMQREYAVYDSNVQLDKGWIDVQVPTTPGAFQTLPQSK